MAEIDKPASASVKLTLTPSDRMAPEAFEARVDQIIDSSQIPANVTAAARGDSVDYTVTFNGNSSEQNMRARAAFLGELDKAGLSNKLNDGILKRA